MGYMMAGNKGNELYVTCSDEAADLQFSIGDTIVKELKKAEKEKTNEYNTDGIINVAMILAECFNDSWTIGAIEEYVKEFIPRFEKFIERESRSTVWDDKDNRNRHIHAFKGILKRLEAFRNRM